MIVHAIYFAYCVSVDMFVSNKRQKCWNNQAQILCDTLPHPRDGLWVLKITKFVFKSFWFLLKFLKAQKNMMKSAFYIVQREKKLNKKGIDYRSCIVEPISSLSCQGRNPPTRLDKNASKFFQRQGINWENFSSFSYINFHFICDVNKIYTFEWR